MAKRTRNMIIQISYDPVSPTKDLRCASFTIDDSSDAAISYQPTGAIAGNRELTSGELSGTLEAFLGVMKAEADALHPA